MRLSHVLMAYFVVGAFLFAGGAVSFNQFGVGGLIISTVDDANVQTNEGTTTQLENTGGPVQQALDTVSGGGLIAAWNFAINFLAYFFWPITVLEQTNAPIELTVTLGGGMSFSMLMGLLAVLRRGF